VCVQCSVHSADSVRSKSVHTHGMPRGTFPPVELRPVLPFPGSHFSSCHHPTCEQPHTCELALYTV
jgi:hypothetical protein